MQETKTSGSKMFVSVIIIIVALGILYFFMRGGNSFGNNPEMNNATNDTQSETTTEFGPQSNSDNLSDIESELDSSDYSSLDIEIQ